MLTCSACNARLKKDEVQQGRCPVCGEFLDRETSDARDTWERPNEPTAEDQRPGTVPVVDPAEQNSSGNATPDTGPRSANAAATDGQLEARGPGDSTWIPGSDHGDTGPRNSDSPQDGADTRKTVQIEDGDALDQVDATEDEGRIGDSTWIPDGTELTDDADGSRPVESDSGGPEYDGGERDSSAPSEASDDAHAVAGIDSANDLHDSSGAVDTPDASDSTRRSDGDPSTENGPTRDQGRIGDSTWIPDGTDLAAAADEDALVSESVDDTISNAGELLRAPTQASQTPDAEVARPTVPDAGIPASQADESQAENRIGDSTWIPDGTASAADAEASDIGATQPIEPAPGLADGLSLETSEVSNTSADAGSDDIGGSTWIPDSESLSDQDNVAADSASKTVADAGGAIEQDDDGTAGDSTWIPDNTGVGDGDEVDEDRGQGTVVVGALSDAESPQEAPEDVAQTYIAPAADDADAIDKTFVTDDLPPETLASMNEAWKGDFDQESRPGMTLQSAKSVTGQRPRESLVIKSRTLSTAAEYDPSSDEYELLNKLGEGGMGVVYHARQTSINRDVAVKMLKAKMSRDEEQRQKFLAEAVVTGDLDHPNIVPIYDVARNEEGALFYAMKKVQGTPWLDVIKDKSESENLQILMRVADAVGFAHMRGVVHRDLKPENVMLGEFGEVLVMDWGLAQPMSAFSKGNSITETSTMGGTPAYMAPEMATGPIAKITPSSDIYLLGAMLYEIVTGKPPHTGKNALKCLMAAAKNVIVPTDKTGELIEIAMKAMETDVALRYPSVQEFQDAIREFQSHTDSVAMSARAADDLDQARSSNDYDDFARALFGYQEAYELWDGNARAAQGVSEARLLYAGSAFEKGDFDLGLSLLDEEDPTHAELTTEIRLAQEERDARQQRLTFYKRAGVAVAVLFLAVVTTAAV